MGFGVAPIDGGQFVNQSNQIKPLDVQDFIQQFNAGAKVIDNEVQMMSKDMMGIRSRGNENKTDVGTIAGREKMLYIPEIEEEMTAELTKETQVDRTRRKKSSWETKMDELAALEGQLGFEKLQGEERDVFTQFFDNMARIRGLRAKLRQLEEKEEQMEDEKRRQNREEMDQERQRRLEEMEKNDGQTKTSN